MRLSSSVNRVDHAHRSPSDLPSSTPVVLDRPQQSNSYASPSLPARELLQITARIMLTCPCCHTAPSRFVQFVEWSKIPVWWHRTLHFDTAVHFQTVRMKLPNSPTSGSLMRYNSHGLEHQAEEQATSNLFDLQAVKHPAQRLSGSCLSHHAHECSWHTASN